MVRYHKVLRPFQEEIYSDHHWERLMLKPQLIIIEVYSQWSGPCVAMLPRLKSLMHHVGDAKLYFAIADAEKLSFLEQFRQRSEPTWLFMMNGKLMNVVFGCNVHQLIRAVYEQLKIDGEVKAGSREQTELDINNLPKQMEEKEEVIVEVKEVKKPAPANPHEIIEYNYCPF